MINSHGYYDDSLSLEDAADYMRNLLAEFPFADWGPEQADGTRNSRSQAVHLMAMLSQFSPRLVPREASRLGYIYNANSQRSGKSLLAKSAIIPPNGRAASQAWTSKDEELRKVVDAEVLHGSRYIFFDNVRTRAHLNSPVLEAFMTSPVWKGRVLGRSQMFEMPNTATVFITGNDLSLSPDLKNRTLEVKLFVREANVQSRHVMHPIDDAWLMDRKNRKAILNALSAIIRCWDDTGQQMATEHVYVGYEQSCQVFGGIVQFAGFGNPLVPPVDLDEDDMDTETADMRALVKILAEPLIKRGERRAEYAYQQVVNVTHENDLFNWMLDGKEAEVIESGYVTRKDFELKPDSNSKLGKLLKRYFPLVGDENGPRFREWRFGKDNGSQVIKTSSVGPRGRRKFIVELPAV